eukprot:TRINITY_DN1579_c0_g2_i1.p1 TRINITY_DN1579_c0_g2~~TRINITY_DN1579_c0_g2_i1.p1  ORF type:complete len:409 (-),score=121.41 TRINITY_DN1579_c0_g2_i1:201-1427(-)
MCEAVIPERFIKLFAKSIHCMGKIGEDLLLELSEDKLTLRAFNSARSAFLVFNLDQKFFDVYTCDGGKDNPIKIQVKLKSCMAVFKQYTNVERCAIRLDQDEERLIFELLCKRGIKKVYRLSYEDADALQAVYSKDAQPNRMVTIPKKLLDCLNNFHGNLEEVTLSVAQDSVHFKSHVEDSKAAAKVLQTEMSIATGDFDDLEVGNETQVTFSLKEFKTILNFCDASGQPVVILFERGGRPLLLSIKYFGVFESDFVLATLVDNGSQPAGSDPSGSVPSSQSSTSASSAMSSMESGAARKRKQEQVYKGSPPSSASASGRSEAAYLSPVVSQGSGEAIASPAGGPMDEDSYADADYEDREEVPGTPPQKMQRLSPEIKRENEEEYLEDDPMMDNYPDEIPCSIPEEDR